MSMTWIAVAALFIGATWLQNRSLLRSNRGIARQAAEDAAATANSLAAIHTLVNSNLTEAQGRELDATRRDLASLLEVVDLKQSQGLNVSDESLAIIEQVKADIKKMAAAQAHKQEQTDIADTQAQGYALGSTP